MNKFFAILLALLALLGYFLTYLYMYENIGFEFTAKCLLPYFLMTVMFSAFSMFIFVAIKSLWDDDDLF